VFAPPPEEIYPPGFRTAVTVEGLGDTLEGRSRPGHFRGVTTVVLKLFEIVQPRLAFFGRKDAQQVRIIQQMTADLNLGAEIVVCPIVREPDGLAMSSRNVYLNPAERKAATVLYRALCEAKAAFDKGERQAERLRQKMKDVLASEPLARVQYVSCADYETLKELEQVRGKALLSMAVFVGKTRLIDNLVIEP
jgi:pantoate--beta-alanine ligase